MEDGHGVRRVVLDGHGRAVVDRDDDEDVLERQELAKRGVGLRQEPGLFLEVAVVPGLIRPLDVEQDEVVRGKGVYRPVELGGRLRAG